MTESRLINLGEKQRIVAVNLYKFALWADTLRRQFDTTLARDREELERRHQMKHLILDRTAIESDMYIRLWFGILYIVIEGWPKLELRQNQPLRIRELLKSPFKDLLRSFRNATFHPADFDDPGIQDLVATGEKSIDWARELTSEFKAFFESILNFPGIHS